jgi:hypothetical protein
MTADSLRITLHRNAGPARPFYEELGFRLPGAIASFPPGHKRFFLKKRFAKPPAGRTRTRG